MRLIAFYPVGIAVASMMIDVSNAMINDGKQTNSNGVEYGKPDKQIKCAFFRVINPRTEKYTDFREDVDKVRIPLRVFSVLFYHSSIDIYFTHNIKWNYRVDSIRS
jgi:hypothetical protein